MKSISKDQIMKHFSKFYKEINLNLKKNLFRMILNNSLLNYLSFIIALYPVCGIFRFCSILFKFIFEFILKIIKIRLKYFVVLLYNFLYILIFMIDQISLFPSIFIIDLISGRLKLKGVFWYQTTFCLLSIY